jgi:hypothetical protein
MQKKIGTQMSRSTYLIVLFLGTSKVALANARASSLIYKRCFGKDVLKIFLLRKNVLKDLLDLDTISIIKV